MNLWNPADYPKTLDINGETYKVKFVKTIRRDKTCVGLCDSKRKEILIKIDQSRGEIFASFIHEMLHAIEFEYDLKISHSLVYSLEKAIIQTLHTNF